MTNKMIVGTLAAVAAMVVFVGVLLILATSDSPPNVSNRDEPDLTQTPTPDE